MYRLFTTLFAIFVLLTANSQLPVLHWAKTFNEDNFWNPSIHNNGRSIGVDAQGNVYSCGYFQYAVDFDPGPGLYSMTGGSQYENGIYISKLDANGNFVWAGQINTLVEWAQIEMEVDPAGNIYLASEIRGSVDMDPGPGVLMMQSIGFRDAFVVKINTNGNLVWAKQFGGPGDTGPTATAIDFDQNYNVIVTGFFNNTVDFDPGPGTYNLTSAAHTQAFFVKLNSNGDLLWAKQFGHGAMVYHNSTVNDFKCDRNGNIIATGQYKGTCDFDPGPNAFMLTSSSGSAGDGFIAKLDGNGNFIWAKSLGQTGGYNHYILPTGVDVDGQGGVVTTGLLMGNFDFDPGPGEFYINGQIDCFILKLNEQGNFVWAKSIGSAYGQDLGDDVVIDGENNVYVGGSFAEVVDFDPGPGTHIITSPYYGPSAIVKLTPGGDFVYAATFPSIDYSTTTFRRMTMDPAKNIYVAGTISGVSDFDPGPGVFPVAGGESSPFVLKLGRCLNATSSSMDISACNSYTLNDQTFNASGTYVQTIPNSTGCDSIITLRLTLNKKQTEQSKTICDGESFFAGGRNQLVSGTYYDTLQTVMGCDSIVTTRLVVNAKPTPNLGADKSLCKGTELTITPGTFNSYLWQNNSTSPSLNVNAAGTYWVQVTNNFNCVASDTFKVVTMLDLPTDFLRRTDSICSYEKIQLEPSRSFNNYQWSTGATSKNIEIQSHGDYYLTVTDANGCKGTDTTFVYFQDCMLGVYIPSAFTPNNDGKNDLFKPQIFGDLGHYQLTVYNRWGTIVFQTTDPNKGWDGRVGGVMQDNAVFIWTCSYQMEGMEKKNEKGTVMIVK